MSQELQLLPDDVGAHHGNPILTRRDLELCEAITLWVRTARGNEKFGYGDDWLPGSADFLKSRLFWRIRSGKKPLEHAPPTCFSCPWYEVIELPGPHNSFDGGTFKWDDDAPERLSIAQCGYDILTRNNAGEPELVGFGPYRFRVWRGPSVWIGANGPVIGKEPDWYIQREEFFNPDNTTRTGDQLLAEARRVHTA